RVKRVAEELIQYGRRRNPWIGIHGEAVGELADLTKQQLGIKVTSGVLVTEIYRTSLAFREGLRPGDVIVRMNGREVAHPSEMDFVNWDLFIGDKVRLDISSQGEAKVLRFKVEELSE
ncbi:MAG: PDZ domain-containing protein, partial [Candidatus Hydrogenedentes bacterium]|nr:PDZ domain-containing protein [Candidatus Hydrogenedentota bacterium]